MNSIFYGKAKEYDVEYAQLFGCNTGSTPFKYLGIPMHHKKLSNSDWSIVEEKIQKKALYLERKTPVGRGQASVNQLGLY